MTNPDQLKDLQTEQVRTKEDIGIAARLSKYYHMEPYRAKELNTIINSDWWHWADFLTDITKIAKYGFEERSAVAFLLLTETNPAVINSRAKTDLQVSCFCTTPFFDEEIAVEWADYRIRKALEYLGRCEKVLWNVDERNVPLQLALKNAGFKLLSYERDIERLTFTK